MRPDRSERPLRIIQTNLQVRDTDAIDPVRLARQIDDLEGNALVFNVGGIYAWYDTEVAHHRKNPHLPEDRDLLGEVIQACQERDITFIGRLDFSKADDEVYAHHPEWFAVDADRHADPIGAERPGGWPLLRSTCTTSAYRNEAVALSVLEELLGRYDLDAIFYNAPQYVSCHCDRCARIYERTYDEPLPQDASEFREEWPERCVSANMRRRYDLISEIDPEVDTILYYDAHGRNLSERARHSDLLCTESQNVLSRGHDALPDRWKPARTMKLANAAPDDSPPVGIIHACPGMDWRHVGLPRAEYAYWVSQIPANNGHLWHTLTGVPDTIADDRMFEVVRSVNDRATQLAGHMVQAESAARTVLLWDRSPSGQGLLDGLIQQQVPFDLLLPEHVSTDRLAEYELVVIPAQWDCTEGDVSALQGHVSRGGQVLVEGKLPDEAHGLTELLGVADTPVSGEDLVASYARFEERDGGNPLQAGLEDTDLLPHRGPVHYCEPREDAESLLTLVPKWSPLKAVGRPPERASIPVEQTEIPLAILGTTGRTLYLPFVFSELLSAYRLAGHYRLLRNAVDLLLGTAKLIEVSPHPGIQVTPYSVDEGYLLHVVNAIGDRPLRATTPSPPLDVCINTGSEVTAVRSMFDEETIPFTQTDASVSFTVPPVEVWQALMVDCSP